MDALAIAADVAGFLSFLGVPCTKEVQEGLEFVDRIKEAIDQGTLTQEHAVALQALGALPPRVFPPVLQRNEQTGG